MGDRLLPPREPGSQAGRYVWLTDFVGWLPMPDGEEREAFYRRLQRRDDRAHRALPARTGPRAVRRQSGRRRTRQLRARTSLDPGLDRGPFRVPRLRERLRPARVRGSRTAARGAGLRPEERVCIVTVGGSGVGEALLRRVIPRSRWHATWSRGCASSSSRARGIDPASLPQSRGPRGARVRARALQAPRGMRPGDRPGRPHRLPWS